MKGYRFLFALGFLLICKMILAQELIQTQIHAETIIENFSSKQTVSWSIPTFPTKNIDLLWKKQNNSAAEVKHVHTWIGYQNQQMTGVITLASGKVFGEIYWDNWTYTISTNKDGFLTIKKENKNQECGTQPNDFPKNYRDLNIKQQETLYAQNRNKPTEEQLVPDDDVLRIYRLAIPISYNTFVRDMHSDVSQVEAFWANAEVILNKIYMRDIGIKFQVLRNKNLIITSPEKAIYHDGTQPRPIISTATKNIDKLIGNQSYDLGIFIVNGYGGPTYGQAFTGTAYLNENKASAVVRGTNLHLIAHEIGHLFGAHHIHEQSTVQTGYSHKTELGKGQSVMGYGFPQNFFSLVSLSDIRSRLLAIPYYSDPERTKKVGEITTTEDVNNFPYGIKTNNKSPILDKNHLKPYYQLPPNTFFEFRLNTQDNNDHILYTTNQVDKQIKGKSFAKFHTPEPSKNNRFYYQDSYYSDGFLEQKLNTALHETYTFWVAANDGESAYLKENHAVRYDIFQTKIEITDTQPFKFIGNVKQAYTKGEHVLLKWNADPMIFKGTKVRILMSDDFGETFPYTLIESTNNNGSCEVIIPQINVGSVPYKQNIQTVRGGVFKIEVIDHIAYALSDLKPTNQHNVFTGGFWVKDSNIIFENTPTEEVFITKNQDLPPIAKVTAKTTFGFIIGELTYQEKTEQIDATHHLLKRIWTAIDSYDNKASFVQKIYIEESSNPTQEISINIQTDECQFTFTDKHDLTKEQLGDDSVLNLKIIEINDVPQNNLNSLIGIQPKTGENIILWKADNGRVFTQKINVARGDCYKDGKIGETLPSSTLISTLDKKIKQIDIPNGLLVLESKTKGLVITRIIKGKNIGDITNPVEGMIVFDENSNCIKLYDGKKWDCIKQKEIYIR